MKHLILLLISFLVSYELSEIEYYPSDLIWNKFLEYYNSDKIIVTDYHHFIFDESNYTGLDINGDQMRELYERQENISQKYQISNYIFVADNIDESQESIENAADFLYKCIDRYFKIDISNSVIALFSIETRRIRIKVGDKTQKYITDSEAGDMIKNLGGYLKKNDYYNAWIKLIKDIEYYRNHETPVWLIVVCIAGAILLVVVFAIICAICCPGKSGSDSSYSGDYGGVYDGGGGGGGGGGATGGW